ncbi:MAG: hypothetical protein E7Z65_06350 [Thermoplasmata archaeon]|nr:hypothetical protein [Thermoplasmata archaeon]
MTLSQDIIDHTVPGKVYTPAEVTELIGHPAKRSSNVKTMMDKLCNYGYFERWVKPKRYLGRDTYAYLRK